MAWDASKHKTIKRKTVKIEDDTYIIEVFSYDKGPQKIKFLQAFEKKGVEEVRPLNNWTPELGLKLAVAMKKMCKEMLGIE